MIANTAFKKIIATYNYKVSDLYAEILDFSKAFYKDNHKNLFTWQKENGAS